jgi:hypothetical protein
MLFLVGSVVISGVDLALTDGDCADKPPRVPRRSQRLADQHARKPGTTDGGERGRTRQRRG